MNQVKPVAAIKHQNLATQIVIALVAGCFLSLAILTLFRRNPENWKTFGTYWESGNAAAHRLNPYTAYPLTHIDHGSVNGKIVDVPDLNLNPPCLLPLFQWLARFDLVKFGTIWTFGSALLLALSIGLLLWNYRYLQLRQILWVSLCAPVFDTFFNGQLYFLLLLLATLTVICTQRKAELASAIFLGLLVAIKPTVIFWPIFLFLSGRYRFALKSFVVSAIVSTVPVFIYGTNIYRQWLRAVSGDTHWTVPTNIALPAFFARLGLPALGYILATAVAVGLGWFVWRKRPDFTTVSGIGLCAMLLCPPLAWYEYVIMLAPAVLARRWGKLETLAAAILMIPTPVTFRLSAHTIPLATSAIYLTAIFLFLFTFVSRRIPAEDQVEYAA